MFPAQRPRRLRRTAALRRLVAETTLTPGDLVAPLFVAEGLSEPRAIASLPGHFQHTLSSLRDEVKALVAAGVSGVILFGVPATKDEVGSGAWDPEGIAQVALRTLRDAFGDELVADGRPLPRRVHDPRPLRRAASRRHGRQRRDPRALRARRPRPGRGRGGRRRPERDDGRPGRRDPLGPRRVRLRRDRHPRLRGEVRERRSTGPSARPCSVEIAGGGDRKGYQQDAATGARRCSRRAPTSTRGPTS